MNTDSPSWQDLLDLVARLDEGTYESAAVEFGDISVRLSRSADVPMSPAVTDGETAPAPAAMSTQAAATAVPAAAPEASNTAEGREPEGTTIDAPMIGVFYRAPSPGAAPFVEPGANVEPDTTVGIIEVMKLMNPVTAGVAGRLTDFLVKDGEQVEFGQSLAIVTDTGAP